MTEYDIIIAGGGHNGLVCGAVLAKAGLTCFFSTLGALSCGI